MVYYSKHKFILNYYRWYGLMFASLFIVGYAKVTSSICALQHYSGSATLLNEFE